MLVSSAPGRLLETIPSRCRPVRFGAIPTARVAETLEAEGVPAPTALRRARLAGGDADRARALAGPEAELRAEAEQAARATLEPQDDAEWVIAEAWAAAAGTRGASVARRRRRQ